MRRGVVPQTVLRFFNSTVSCITYFKSIQKINAGLKNNSHEGAYKATPPQRKKITTIVSVIV